MVLTHGHIGAALILILCVLGGSLRYNLIAWLRFPLALLMRGDAYLSGTAESGGVWTSSADRPQVFGLKKRPLNEQGSIFALICGW